jgi:hypothetical protein
VVEHWTRHPKVWGSRPLAIPGTGISVTDGCIQNDVSQNALGQQIVGKIKIIFWISELPK